MKVYSVEANDGDAPITFGSKREAVKHARACRKECPARESVTVDELTLVPITKAVVVRLINVGGGYVVARRTVASFPSKRKERQE